MGPEIFLPVAFVIGYLLGSIPFGLVLTRLAGTQDLRSVGSDNIGATNVLRTGRKLPPESPISSAGRVDMARISVFQSISPLWIRRSAAGSMVCSPTAPAAASANGNRFTSTSCGL